jgi:hypothetical protein
LSALALSIHQGVFLVSLPKTRDDLAGVLSSVRTGENCDLLAKNAIPDEIREAMNNRSLNLSIQSWIDERSFGDYGEDLGNFRMQLGAETGALRLVPYLRLSNVEFCSTTNLDLELNAVFVRAES